MENHGKRTARLASFSWFHLRGILSVMAQQRHVLLPHHDAMIGGNDPSELLVIGPRALFEPCVAKGEDLPCGVRSWEGWRCGYHATQFIYWAYSNGIMPFFYFTDLKLHLLRLDGDIRSGIMRPLSKTLKRGNDPVLGLVDLTKGAKCALGGDARRCTREGSMLPAPSSCWGKTSFVQVNGVNGSFYGFWACRGRRDIDQGVCHFDGKAGGCTPHHSKG